MPRLDGGKGGHGTTYMDIEGEKEVDIQEGGGRKRSKIESVFKFLSIS